MHVTLTASLLILNPLGISGTSLQIFSFALAATVWVVVAVIAARNGWQLEQRPIPNTQRAA